MTETPEVAEDRRERGSREDSAASSQRRLPRPWLVSYPPGVPPSYDYPRVPVTRFLDDAARDFPDLAATWFEKATISYSSLLRQVDRLASAFSDLGVRPGTRVGLVLPNLPAVPIALFASLRLAAIVVPIHPEASSEELHYQLEESGSELVICAAPVLPRIEALRARLPRLRTMITTQVGDWLQFPRRNLAAFGARQLRRLPGSRPPLSDLEVLRLPDLLRGPAPIAKQAPTEPYQVALIAYSKGTERSNRRIALSHANLIANAFQARLWMADIQAGKERVLLGLPPADLHGLVVGLLSGVLSAATLLLLPRFHAESALKVIAQQRPTLLPAVPGMWTALVEHRSAASTDLSSLRAGLSNGPLSATVVRRFQALSGGRLRECYGPVGTSPLTHANPLYGRNAVGRIGLPVTDTCAAVVDVSDPIRLLPPGEVGRLAVWGPQITGGHWNRLEDNGEGERSRSRSESWSRSGSWHAQDRDETAQDRDETVQDRGRDRSGRSSRDGWLVTEDLAVVDEDGSFAIIRSGPVRRRPTRPRPRQRPQFPRQKRIEDSTEDLR